MKIIEKGNFVSAVVYGRKIDATDATAVSEYCLFARHCSLEDHDAYMGIPSHVNNYVFIGADNEFAKEMGVVVPREKFTDDTAYILVKDNYVVLDGGKRGKLYAVYEFLERFWGVRFYAPEHIKTPFTTDLEIKDQEIIYTPPFKIRNVYAYDFRWDREFSARSRINGGSFTLGLEAFGGSMSFAKPECHTTFKVFFPPEDPEVGFAKHPEYYALTEKGERVGRHYITEQGGKWGLGEICWSHPEVIDILTERLKKWILNDPAMSIFSVSMNDWGPFCQCPKCTELAKKHGKDGEPRWIAPILYALNIVGKRIKEWQKTDERVKDRTIYIETLAYHQATQAPTNMEVEDNIIIRYCTTTCYYHQMDDENCVVNSKQISELDEWGKITKNLFLWDYSDNYCNRNAFNTILNVIQSKYKVYAKKGIVGVFNEYNASPLRGGTWFYVRQYLYAKMLWNPDVDFNKEMRECMEFIYGKEAAPYLMEVERRFIESIKECGKEYEASEDEEKVGFHLPCKYLLEKIHFSDSFLNTVGGIFEMALSKTKLESHKLAIRRDYVCFKWCKMYLNRGKDYVEMQEVLDEIEALGMGDVALFKKHYYGDIQDDLFRDEIAVRNRKNYQKGLSVWM